MTAQPMSGRILYSCESQPNRRPASFFIALALIGLSVFAMFIAVISASGLSDPVYRQPAIVTFTISLLALAYVGYFAMRLHRETLTKYALDISASGIRERVVEQSGKNVQTSMSFNEMNFVEHYTPRDRETLLFHSFDGRIIEMPMWSIHEQVPNVLNHVQEHGIKVEENP